MGADRKGPPLPAPTETDSTTGGTELGSRITEKSQFTLPEDGSPVTIATRRKKGDKDSHGLSNNKSQTSLLIEYFEGGKGSHADTRRPSVRVKVTPSSKSKRRSSNDHIQITERGSNRKPSYTKRIHLSPNARSDKSIVGGDGDDNSSLHSYRSATEESNVTSRGGGPVEVEIMPRRHGSPLIPTAESSSKYAQVNASEFSSMPTDSFLDGKSQLAAGAGAGLVTSTVADKLGTPPRRRSRSLSRERIVVQKAAEKVRSDKTERRRKHSSRSRSVSGEQSTESVKSPRRRSSRSHHEESMVSGADSSLLNSHLSGKSGDAHSFRSGTSKSSINNPKLLETVEDAIRRLILPELTALKREQSKHQSRDRDRDRRGSITSGSGISRDSRDETSSNRRLSDRGSNTDLSARPKVVLNDNEVLSGNTIKGRKVRNIDRLKAEEESSGSFERETSEETVIRNGEKVHKKGSSDGHRGLKPAAARAGLGALTIAALHKHQSEESLEDERRERRRRRTKSRSRSDSLTEIYEEQKNEPMPPMPLMSEINPSDITRTSILSAETERPHSASQERVTQIRQVSRGVVSPTLSTPTRTPVALSRGLGMQHSNFSRGNLSLHSQPSQQHLHEEEFDLDEHGRKVPMQYSDREASVVDEDYNGGSPTAAAGLTGAAGASAFGAATMHHLDDNDDHEDSELLENDHYSYYQNTQEVPPPLRYVPYAQERRGLSPIQSVSGYTEGDPDLNQRDSRLTRSSGSYSSLGKSPQQRQSGMSIKSLDSLGNARRNRHDFAEVRQGGLTDSELTQDGEYWEEQHRENDRVRDIGSPSSYRSSDHHVDYKRMTNSTDNSMYASKSDRGSTGQNVRGIEASPDYVHMPVSVESAVASLVNASELTGESGFSGNNGQYDRRASYASHEEGSERLFTSRGNSPTKANATTYLEYDESDRGTSSQRNSPSKWTEEYDVDESGHKIAMPKYKTHKTEKAIAAGVAAVVMAGRSKMSTADQIKYEDRLEHTGAPLHMSFKQRTMDGQGHIPSPRHSIDAPLSGAASHDQLKLGTSGLPDVHNPMPEIGYGDGESEVDTNPSIIQGPIGEVAETNRDHWPGKPTPPQAHFETASNHSRNSDANLKSAEAALIGAAVGAGGAAALAGHNREASRDHEEWQRTSGERKRDTVITNPYEGTSPIAVIGNDLDRDLLSQAGGLQGLGGNFIPTKLDYQSARASPKDEGYISSAPNARSPGEATPEQRAKGVNFLDQDLAGAGDMAGEDPFYTRKHARHLSGMSHGMGSPMYDSATGNGIDRIQSKDIVALMDHLTVRDAQRSARDTEILVTLVRAAAEMRNSFEDMKRLLADSEDVIITEVQGNTDKSVQKAINGPRPQPQSGPRSLRRESQDENMFDDIPNKKRNVFRRALKGLSMKSSNDIGRIEEMLVQLLGEVEGLKVAQGLKVDSQPGESYDDLGPEDNYDDRGYEPEGNAGTSTASHASRSGHLSIPISRRASANKVFDNRKFSDHRISTVPEGDEEDMDPHEQAVSDNRFEINEQLLSPTREVTRGSSVPLDTPPQQHAEKPSLSNENTPRIEKSKKHKSSSSSGWIPKVSRWSNTTASTVLRGFRNSGRSSGPKVGEQEQYPERPSRSGSDLGNYAGHDPYGDDKLPLGNSQEQINQLQYGNQQQEPSMSLLPPEDPKYKAHRNSLNLQHPQPRVGPTHRYQTALESQAQNFDSPLSPRSLDWGSQTSLNRLPPQQTNRYNNDHTGRISPVSDGGYSHGSASNQPPQRPPKEPLTPEGISLVRTSKFQKPSPLSKEHLPMDAYEPSSSPRSASRLMPTGVPPRKPTGPRTMSTSSRSGGDLNRDETVIRRNAKRDTFGTIASKESGESKT